MNIPGKIFLGGLLMLCSLALKAQDNQVQSNQVYNYSLKQCIDYALANQPAMLNAKIDEEIADQKIRQTRGIGLPQVNGSFEFDDNIVRPTLIIQGGGPLQGKPPGTDATIQFGTNYTATPGISASQLIFDGAYLVGLQAAKTYMQLAKVSTTRSSIDVTTNVTKAYYAVIVNEKRIASLDANITQLQKTLNDTKAMNQQGVAEKLDVDRLTVTLGTLQVQRENVKNLINLNYYLLKLQMGMPMNAGITLTDSMPTQFAAPVPEVAEFNKRVEYNLLQINRRLDYLDMQRYKAAYLPSLSAFGSYSTQAQRNQFDFFNTNQKWYASLIIGARLTLPIFNGFQREALIKQAKLTLDKNQNDIKNLENSINFQVSQTSISYENNYKTLETQRQNMELAKEVTDVTRKKYEQGVGTNLEVVTAETAFTQAQTAYFNAVYDLLVSQVDLQNAKGTLTH